ncbi:peroxiredoxin [Bryobacterales bacterium F-183]|nr:peroxiredoxin [Bryobacterales bacterium F-183]
MLTFTTFAIAALMAAGMVEKGSAAPDFALQSLRGKQVRLSEELKHGPVALVVLRGFPGYQCPLCNRQVQDFIRNQKMFEGERVLFVYPGPPDNLEARAKEFAADKSLPENFDMLLDPDYKFTNQYGLRWDAPKETAYPSTYLIGKDGKVFYSKISMSHGGRTDAAEIAKILNPPPAQ